MTGIIVGLVCLAFVGAYLTLRVKAISARRRGDSDREDYLAAGAFKLRTAWIGAVVLILFVVLVVAVATH